MPLFRHLRVRAHLQPRLLPPAKVLAAIAAVAVLAAPACLGRAVPVEGAAPAIGEADERTQNVRDIAATLIVENARMVDYRIYLTRQGGERLGVVSGPGRATFLLRGSQLPHTGDLRVVAVPIASNEVLSSQAYLPRGRTARFRILPNNAYLVVDALPAPAEPDSASPADTTAKPPR